MEIFGEEYYIDLDGLIESCEFIEKLKNNDSGDESVDFDVESEAQINLFKYEIAKLCIQRVLSDDLNVDDDYQDQTLSSLTEEKNKPTSFKIAFNSLVNNGILKIK